MCSGPVKVKWGNTFVEDNINDKLVILVATDFAEIDENKPDIAKHNEFDFYFLALENILADNVQLAFWFPYKSEGGMEVGSNDAQRTKEYFTDWHRKYLNWTLQRSNPDVPYSYGWNEKKSRQTLALKDGESVYGVTHSLLDKIEEGDFALRDSISIESLEFEGDASHLHQHFVATLNGHIKKGEIFHIYFKAKNAEGLPDDYNQCAGSAWFYYYDHEYEPDVINHPFEDDPLVPCALLHVSLRFPYNTVTFSPKKTWVKAKSFSRSRRSPTGQHYKEMYWFSMYNAHDKYTGVHFEANWEMPGCSEDGVFYRVTNYVDGISGTILERLVGLTDEQYEVVRSATLLIVTLTPRQKEIAELIAAGHANLVIAKTLGIAPKTVKNHYEHIKTKLKIRQSTIDSRVVIALAISIYAYLIKSEKEIDIVDAFFKSKEHMG